MRTAETVLTVIRNRGINGLPLDDVYRQLFNPSLYLLAYSRIYGNDGAMTRGTTEETVDGMSREKIETIIDKLRYERYRWTPVRRVHIPKKNGKTRPLGLPTWSDKLLQEVLRLILEAYYEPRFSESSHGFRRNRGCHTALHAIQEQWTATTWFIEGDIRGCFDNIDHDRLMAVLREHITDNRFLRLLANLFKAGYLEDWKYNVTLSGVPQGGIVSPILTNIYLDRLDKFAEETLIPEYTRGKTRAKSMAYMKRYLRAWYLRRTGRNEDARALEKEYQSMPSLDTHDPGFRRLRYVRYADDFLLGFIGPITEAQEIKAKLEAFLRESLRLELSGEKTLITHARTHAAKFVGYEIVTQHDDHKHTEGRRSINGRIALRVPAKFVEEHCAHYMANGKPVHRPELMNYSDFAIVREYQAKYRGYTQYYKLAVNIGWLDRLHWVMQTSLLKTLAYKHRCSVNQARDKYLKVVECEQGPRKCIEIVVPRAGKKPLVARFGGIALQRDPSARIADHRTDIRWIPRSELLTRLLASTCEICGATEGIQVHHVRALKDLHVRGQKAKPQWMALMSAMKRKTLVVCSRCHAAIHSGQSMTMPSKSVEDTGRAV